MPPCARRSSVAASGAKKPGASSGRCSRTAVSTAASGRNRRVSELVADADSLSWRCARQEERIRPLASRRTTDELIRVLGYPKFRLSKDDREHLLTTYLPWCEAVAVPDPPPDVPRCLGSARSSFPGTGGRRPCGCLGDRGQRSPGADDGAFRYGPRSGCGQKPIIPRFSGTGRGREGREGRRAGRVEPPPPSLPRSRSPRNPAAPWPNCPRSAARPVPSGAETKVSTPGRRFKKQFNLLKFISFTFLARDAYLPGSVDGECADTRWNGNAAEC